MREARVGPALPAHAPVLPTRLRRTKLSGPAPPRSAAECLGRRLLCEAQRGSCLAPFSLPGGAVRPYPAVAETCCAQEWTRWPIPTHPTVPGFILILTGFRRESGCSAVMVVIHRDRAVFLRRVTFWWIWGEKLTDKNVPAEVSKWPLGGQVAEGERLESKMRSAFSP